MTELIWPAIALVSAGLSYDLLKRWIGNAPSKDVAALREEFTAYRKTFDAHEKDFDSICGQWRQKVLEQDGKIDRVVSDARNEIAGAQAAVTDAAQSTKWR